MLQINLDPFNTYTFPTVVDALMNENSSGGPICKVAFSASGLFLAAACPTRRKDAWQLSIWDLTTGGAAAIVPVPATLTGQQPSSLISLVWDQSVLLLAFSNCHLVMYDCQMGRFIMAHEGIVDPAPLVAVNGSGGSGKEDADELLDVSLTISPDSGRRSWVFVFRRGRIQTLPGEQLRASIEGGTGTIILPNGGRPQQLPSPILCLAKGQQHLFLISAEPTNHLRIVDRQSGAERTLALEIACTQILGASAAADAMLLGLILRDKTIRILEVDVGMGTIRQRHKLQDAVNRWNWATCGFSNDSELIWGAVNASDTHIIYIWEAKSGALVRMLEGPRDELVTAVWDPRRPSLISITSLGRILRWVPEYPVKWCAMVPGLEEITENVEYVEREDEFDLTVQASLEAQRVTKALLGQAQESERIQVCHPYYPTMTGIWPSECVRLFVSRDIERSATGQYCQMPNS